MPRVHRDLWKMSRVLGVNIPKKMINNWKSGLTQMISKSFDTVVRHPPHIMKRIKGSRVPFIEFPEDRLRQRYREEFSHDEPVILGNSASMAASAMRLNKCEQFVQHQMKLMREGKDEQTAWDETVIYIDRAMTENIIPQIGGAKSAKAILFGGGSASQGSAPSTRRNFREGMQGGFARKGGDWSRNVSSNRSSGRGPSAGNDSKASSWQEAASKSSKPAPALGKLYRDLTLHANQRLPSNDYSRHQKSGDKNVIQSDVSPGSSSGISDDQSRHLGSRKSFSWGGTNKKNNI